MAKENRKKITTKQQWFANNANENKDNESKYSKPKNNKSEGD